MVNNDYLDKNWIKKMVKSNNSSEFIANCFDHFSLEYSCTPDSEKFPKVKPGDILDEEKSVRWNREEVERLRNARSEEVKRLNREKAEINKLYTDGLIKRLAKENHITIDEAKIIWGKAYDMEHSSGVHACISEFVDLADMYAELKSTKEDKGLSSSS